MSQENADVVRLLVARWNAGEHAPDAIADYVAPSFELESPFSTLAGEPYRGFDGIEEWRREIDEQFSEWRIDLEDVREAGDAVVAAGLVHGRGRASGIGVEFAAAVVAHFGGDGRIERMRIYLNTTEALKAVGLAE